MLERFLMVGALLVHAGCSDDDGAKTSGDASSGTSAASGGGDGLGSWCVCKQPGSTKVTGDAAAACAQFCSGLGGLVEVQPAESAIGGPECDAFCAKADGLGCPGETCAQKEDFWCTTGVNDCVEALKARLSCAVEKGNFTCDADSWQLSSSCSTFTELCDGG